MKRLIISILFLSTFLLASNCEDELNVTRNKSMKNIFDYKINALESTAHSLSRSNSSSSSLNELGFLEFESEDCTPKEKKKFKVYQSIVALFGINKGDFKIDRNISDHNYKEVNNFLLQGKDEFENEDILIPIVNENEKYTKQHIQYIVSYYKGKNNLTIKDIDLNDLEKHINQVQDENKNNSALTLGGFEEKLSKHIYALKTQTQAKSKTKTKKVISKKKNEVSNFLFSIAEDKHFYKNPSWLAMNFYDTILFDSFVDGQLLGTPIQTVKSDLIVDENQSSHYKYFMLKDGTINKDKNISKNYHYFLAEDGIINPYNEMKATLHYFFNDKNKRNERICEYYNRYILLKQLFKKYDIDKEELTLNCHELDEDEVRGYRYSYIYVTSGKDSEEAYGHTMLYNYKGQKESNTESLINKTPLPKNLMEIPIVTLATEDKKHIVTITPSELNKTNEYNITISSNTKYDYNSSYPADEVYINFGVPPIKNPNLWDKLSYQIKGFTGDINGQFNIHKSETFLTTDYKNRMIVKLPISVLDNDFDKKMLLAAHLQHIEKNHLRFKFPYKFISKNCAYIISDILEVPFPELRKRFNEEGYFSFAPKDVFNLLEGELNVNAHEAKQY